MLKIGIHALNDTPAGNQASLTLADFYFWKGLFTEEAEPPCDEAESLDRQIAARPFYDEAERLYRQTVEIRESEFGPEHEEVKEALAKLLQFFCRRERKEEAELLFERIRAINAKQIS